MIRFSAISLTALLSSFSLAGDGMLGTKGDGTSAFQGSSSAGGSLLQMIIAVIVVFALMKFLLPKMMAKFGGKLSTKVGGGIQIEESANFPGGTLYVVNVRDRSLLLGVTGTSINTLADLGMTNKPNPGPTFMEYLETAQEPVVEVKKEVITQAVVAIQPTEIEEEVASISVENSDEAKKALNRLQKLIG